MILREGNYFVAYTPALDLSVQAKTKTDVQKRFSEAVQLFIEELLRLGTIEVVLDELGWVKQTLNTKTAWTPPQIVTGTPQQIGVDIPAFA